MGDDNGIPPIVSGAEAAAGRALAGQNPDLPGGGEAVCEGLAEGSGGEDAGADAAGDFG